MTLFAYESFCQIAKGHSFPAQLEGATASLARQCALGEMIGSSLGILGNEYIFTARAGINRRRVDGPVFAT